jgi:hypothetical protein
MTHVWTGGAGPLALLRRRRLVQLIRAVGADGVAERDVADAAERVIKFGLDPVARVGGGIKRPGELLAEAAHRHERPRLRLFRHADAVVKGLPRGEQAQRRALRLGQHCD